VYKYFFVLLLAVFIGCGGSSKGGTDLNPFNVSSFDPYSEPYFKNAWHLQRVKGTNPDSHINIFDAWNSGVFGDGVKVAVIDFEFNPFHEDIKDNVIETFNVDTNSPEVIKSYPHSRHGTGCADIIAGEKNEVGTIGVAPHAKLILIDANITNDGFHG